MIGVEEKKDKIIPSGNMMTGENGSAEVSSSNSVVKEADGSKNGKQEEARFSVPFHKLFSFADSTDVLLMIVGTIGAVANGAAMPLMTVLFGNLVQSFGGAQDIHEVARRVSMVSVFENIHSEACLSVL